MNGSPPPIQPDLPHTGLTPLELAQDVISRIESGNSYARSRKNRFRARSTAVRVGSMTLSLTSTIILGLQKLNAWTGVAFALVAAVTVVNSLEPFFAWRSRWVLMEETQHRFYRLQDELTYYLAAHQPDQLDSVKIREAFDEYQRIWNQQSSRWLEFRRTSGPAG